jgi:hypothetical protein
LPIHKPAALLPPPPPPADLAKFPLPSAASSQTSSLSPCQTLPNQLLPFPLARPLLAELPAYLVHLRPRAIRPTPSDNQPLKAPLPSGRLPCQPRPTPVSLVRPLRLLHHPSHLFLGERARGRHPPYSVRARPSLPFRALPRPQKHQNRAAEESRHLVLLVLNLPAASLGNLARAYQKVPHLGILRQLLRSHCPSVRLPPGRLHPAQEAGQALFSARTSNRSRKAVYSALRRQRLAKPLHRVRLPSVSLGASPRALSARRNPLNRHQNLLQHQMPRAYLSVPLQARNQAPLDSRKAVHRRARIGPNPYKRSRRRTYSVLQNPPLPTAPSLRNPYSVLGSLPLHRGRLSAFRRHLLLGQRHLVPLLQADYLQN